MGGVVGRVRGGEFDMGTALTPRSSTDKRTPPNPTNRRTSLVSSATRSCHCLTDLSPQVKKESPSGATERPRTKPECA